MIGDIALLLWVFILLPFVDYVKAAGFLMIDVDSASTVLVVVLYGLLSGATFAGFRWVKTLGAPDVQRQFARVKNRLLSARP